LDSSPDLSPFLLDLDLDLGSRDLDLDLDLKALDLDLDSDLDRGSASKSFFQVLCFVPILEECTYFLLTQQIRIRI